MHDKFNHAEAFMLMTYQCETCGAIEQLWNSRDGVTPFTVACQICYGTMRHINWRGDIFTPEYVPQPGQRVFINVPSELRVVLARWQAKQYGEEHFNSSSDLANFVKRTAEEMPAEEPWIITWPGA